MLAMCYGCQFDLSSAKALGFSCHLLVNVIWLRSDQKDSGTHRLARSREGGYRKDNLPCLLFALTVKWNCFLAEEQGTSSPLSLKVSDQQDWKLGTSLRAQWNLDLICLPCHYEVVLVVSVLTSWSRETFSASSWLSSFMVS